MTRQWDPSKNKDSKKRRVWIYDKEELWKYGLVKEAYLANLEHDHRFTQKDTETGYEFEYLIISNHKIVARVPVQIIKDLQGRRNAS